MNKVQTKRLLNVARALRESPAPKLFNMSKFVWGDNVGRWCSNDPTFALNEKNFCGTPACALGHYGARKDLQKTFSIKIGVEFAELVSVKPNPSEYEDDEPDYFVSCNTGNVLEHFGLTLEESHTLFAEEGCGGAKTAKGAASFIEKFVAKKLKAQARAT